MVRKISGLTVLLLMVPGLIWAAELSKIGVVDFGEIVERSIAGKEIQKKIQQKGNELKSELESAQVEIRELQEKFKQEAPLWSKEKREEKEGIFKAKINGFNRLKVKNEKAFNEFKAKLINEVKTEFVSFARKKAEKEGYLMIVEKQSGSIIYTHDSVNITEEILTDMDKHKNTK